MTAFTPLSSPTVLTTASKSPSATPLLCAASRSSGAGTSTTRRRRRRHSRPDPSAVPSPLPAALELQRAQDPASLVDVSCRRSHELKPVHLVDALWRLAKMALRSWSGDGDTVRHCRMVSVSQAERLVQEATQRINAPLRDIDGPLDSRLVAEMQNGRVAVTLLRSVVVLKRCGALANECNRGKEGPVPASLSAADSLLLGLGDAAVLSPGDLSSIEWALASLHNQDDCEFNDTSRWPRLSSITRECGAQFPFRVCVNSLHITKVDNDIPWSSPDHLVAELRRQVSFHRETIVLADGDTATKSVLESRETAWQAVRPDVTFEYSGKSMRPVPFSPLVARIGERAAALTAHGNHKPSLYHGVLLNYYPNGKSGMRFHSDPGQGETWDADTAVVSVGAPRQFCFRVVPGSNFEERHEFVVFSGDVVWMRGDCQKRYQHAIKVEETENHAGPRISLVFKRLLGS